MIAGLVIGWVLGFIAGLFVCVYITAGAIANHSDVPFESVLGFMSDLVNGRKKLG